MGATHVASLELDRPVERGVPLSGRVNLRVAFEQDYLVSVVLQALVHGKVQQIFIFREHTIHAGRLPANESRVFAFSIDGLDGVPHHRGTLFSVEPRLAVVVRVPSLEEKPTALERFVAHLGRPSPAVVRAHACPSATLPVEAPQIRAPRKISLRERRRIDASPEAKSAKRACVVASVGVLAALAAVALHQAWLSDSGPWVSLAVAFLPALLLGMAVFVLVLDVRRVLAFRRVGALDVEIARRPGPGGDTLDVRVRVATGRVDWTMSARLAVVEVVRIHRGSTTDEHEHVVAEQQGQMVPSGEPGTYAMTLALPPDGSVPLPFHAKDVEIAWRLLLSMPLRGWRGFARTLPLEVVREGVSRTTSTVTAWSLE